MRDALTPAPAATAPADLELPPAPPETGPESLRGYLAELRARVAAWTRDGAGARRVAARHADGADRLLVTLHASAAAAAPDADALALVATGGWGRRELSPYSDLDLLFLVSEGSERGAEKRIERFLYALWDLGLVLSHAVRSPAECARAAQGDLRVATSLLEARAVCDEGGLAAQLRQAVRGTLFAAGTAPFVERLREERQSRARRFADSIYLLEPDLKGGPGGLRDLNVARWAARAAHDADDFGALLKRGALTARQASELEGALEFFLGVRAHAHVAAGRRSDRLTFEVQDTVARALGLADTEAETAAERLMREYYRHARAVAARTPEILARAAESGTAARRPAAVRLDAHFRLYGAELTLVDSGGPAGLAARPALAVEAFRLAQRRGVRLHPYTRERLAEAARALARLCAAPDESLDQTQRAERARAHALFLELLCDPADRQEALAAMHEVGVLGALLPEFAQIECLWRRDLFHVYTVDVHTLRAVECLRALLRGDLAAEQPRLTEIARDAAGAGAAAGAAVPLFLGMLLHDCGKLHGTRHSEVGAGMAAAAAARLGLAPGDVETVRLLVLHHLLMSHIATKRDFSDEALLAQFARTVGTLARLDALYLLTFADVSSVGPGVLSSWSASLLAELYERAREALLRGDARGPDAAARAEAARARLREAAAAAPPAGGAPAVPAGVLADFLRSADERQLLGHPTADLLAQLRCLAAYAAPDTPRPFALRITERPGLGVAEVIVACADAPGVLARLAGAFTASGADILGARIYSVTLGDRRVAALDVFQVADPDGRAERRAARWSRFEADLAGVLSGRVQVADLVARRRGDAAASGGRTAARLPAERHRVAIDNDVAARYTVVDVHTEDRPGVLWAVADTLHRLGVSIVLSKIATEAEEVADAFYVTEAAGGGKILDAARLDALRAALLAAVRRLPWESPDAPVGGVPGRT
ncbi:MAG TPA: [protein-PII] uridylyltransferase [Myxococcota bacterium]|nr:[protein-PII] uridylyltransferase [Myxococcota bacterium]